MPDDASLVGTGRRRALGRSDSFVHGMKLMVAGELLRPCRAISYLVSTEIDYKIEETVGVEHTFDNGFEFGFAFVGDVAAIKSHNPFAVNDIAFARATGVDVNTMNNYGCSLIWGHPQGPTGLRAIVELIEELAIKGGGLGLFQGCAAGDSSMAVVVEVSGR